MSQTNHTAFSRYLNETEQVSFQLIDIVPNSINNKLKYLIPQSNVHNGIRKKSSQRKFEM